MRFVNIKKDKIFSHHTKQNTDKQYKTNKRRRVSLILLLLSWSFIWSHHHIWLDTQKRNHWKKKISSLNKRMFRVKCAIFTWKSVHIYSTNIDLTKRPGNCAEIKSVEQTHINMNTKKKSKKHFLQKKICAKLFDLIVDRV